jgi:CSLREA domain-containing protein
VIDVKIGSGAPYDFAGLVGSGAQLQSIAQANPNSISIRFSEEVLVTSGALQVINLDGSSPGAPTSFTYDISSETAMWTFGSTLADGRYLLRLSDSVFDLDHSALDGEFTNPWTLSATGTSVFPSGDGTPGGEFRFHFTVLAADSDHDNIAGATNYTNWQSYEPGAIYVSTTADDFDGNLSFGGTSLREAVNYANTASEPTTIVLPTGRYVLTRVGTEGTGTAYNDLDALSAMTIQGDGAGLSVIAPGWTYQTGNDDRIFEARGSAAHLTLKGLTLADEGGDPNYQGLAALVDQQAKLDIVDSAVVNDTVYDTEYAIHSMGSDLTILRSVITNDHGYDGAAVFAEPWGGHNGSLTIGQSIFALNGRYATNGNGATPNVAVNSGVALADLGGNLFDNATGGFFNVLSATGDHLGTPTYVVTTVADEFNHTNDAESLSVREAVDLANQASGSQEIWIPAWHFTLTRDRGTATTDTDTSIGDIDVKDSAVIRGIAGLTAIGWKPGVVDKVFELVGDYNGNGTVDAADYTVYTDNIGSTTNLNADGNDNGIVDSADYSIWSANSGHTLQIDDVAS